MKRFLLKTFIDEAGHNINQQNKGQHLNLISGEAKSSYFLYIFIYFGDFKMRFVTL